MHKSILKDAADDQVRSFAYDFIGMLKGVNPELYRQAEDLLYKDVYGCHFNEWSLACATEGMINEDGTTGPHWTVEQTDSVAKQHGIRMQSYNKYDWNYVMNMVYSDYYGVIGNDTDAYCKVARRFIEDRDAPEGKAYVYYMSMRH